MKQIFLAYSFRPENEELVKGIERLVQSHSLVLDTGDKLGGDALTSKTQEKIKACDALIALLTRDKEIAGQSGWHPTDWVKGELTLARARGQSCIAVLEKDTALDGPFAENERILLDREKTLSMYLRLSETIGTWKVEAGRSFMIRLLPFEVGELVVIQALHCRYRVASSKTNIPGERKQGWIDEFQAGYCLYVEGVHDDDYIQVEILEGGVARWRSPLLPQMVTVDLKAVKKT